MKSIYCWTAVIFTIVAVVALLRPHVMKAGPGSAPAPNSTAAAAASPAQKTHWAENYGKLPLSFEANKGQTDGRVKFLSHGRGYSLFLTGDEAILKLGRARQIANGKSQKVKFKTSAVPTIGSASADVAPTLRSARAGLKSGATTLLDESMPDDGPTTTDSVLRMKLVGANARAAVTGADILPGKSNYFIGNDPKKWQTNLPTYAKVKYQDVYPGVDLVYHGNQSGLLEYDFVVAPGTDPRVIALDVAADLPRHPDVGAGLVPAREGHPQGVPLQITANGDLVVKTSSGEVRLHKPVVYQPANYDGQRKTDNRQRTPVDGHYVLQANDQVGFQVASYDHTRPLVIDPVLSYSTYLGGSYWDTSYGIAVDSSNHAYVTGFTGSADFPTLDPYQGTNKAAPNFTVFVAKLNPAGDALVYSTYLGGSTFDEAYAIAVDSSGDAYVTGESGSADFPTVNPIQSTCYGCPGFGSAFVTELNPAGSGLIYSTYLGYSETSGEGIAVDSSGNAYVTGLTRSYVPTTANAYQNTFSGFGTAFVTKFNFNAASNPPLKLAYSTYLSCSFATPCGDSETIAFAIALDSQDNAYVTGYTQSAEFPTTPNAFQATCGGCSQGKESPFVTKLNSAGSALVYSTFLGGSNGQYGDGAYGIAVDASGNAYVTGQAYSTDFPTKNPIQATCASCSGGSNDAFVAELNATGSALVYSTYLGGDWYDEGYGIAVDSSGNTYVTGRSNSTDFPTWNWLQLGTGYCGNAFVADLNFNASSTPPLTLAYSTYFGPVCNSGNIGQGIAIDSSGNAYITGYTGTGLTTVNPLQTTDNATYSTVYVAKLAPGTPAVSLSPPNLTFGSQAPNTTSAAQTVTLTNTGNATLMIVSTDTSGAFAQSNHCGTSVAAEGSCTLSVTFTPYSVGTATGSITITDNASSTSPQTIALSGTGGRTVTLAPTALNFGNQAENTTSAPQVITLGNPLDAALAIYIIAASSDFGETNTCGASVPAHGTCTISVTFAPTVLGGEAGTLTITDNAGNSPQTVGLSGTGIVQAVVSPTYLEFSGQGLETTSAAQNVKLTNNLSTALPFSATFTGANPGDFAETDNCAESVPAKSSCTISVTFTPAAAGTRTATMDVSDAANTSPQTVALSGVGLPVVLAPSSLQFGGQAENSTSAPQTVTLNNTQSTPLAIASIAASGDFAQTNSCPMAPNTLAAKGKCTLSVTFTPSTLGGETGTLTVTDNASNSPQTTALSGTGVLPATVSPPSLAFAAQGVGSPSAAESVTLTINLSSALAFSVTFTGANPGDFAEADSCGGSVAAKSFCTMSVTFTPSARGSRTATMNVNDGTTNSPQTVALSGTGAVPVAVSPNSLAFYGQVGVTGPGQDVTLTNNLSTALPLTITFTGSDPNDFAETDTCNGSLAADSQCTISVTFTAGAGGSRTATMNVNDSAHNSPQTIALSASAINPVLLTPFNELSFGNQEENTTSAPQTATLTNMQSVPLAISSITTEHVGGKPAVLPFNQTNTCGSSVPAQGTCTITVTFTPALTTTYGGNLAVTGNASSNPHPVHLNGTGTPGAQVLSRPLQFPSTTVGSTSAALNVYVSTLSRTPLPITVTITNANVSSELYAGAGDFAETDNCGGGLGGYMHNSSCTIAVAFTPSPLPNLTNGIFDVGATMTINDGSTKPPTVALQGTVYIPRASVGVSPSSLAFLAQTPGTTSPPMSVLLFNNSTSTLTINPFTFTGANPGDFAQTNNCGGSLNAVGDDRSCTISVTFTPGAAGLRTATMNINDSDSTSPQTLALTGGLPPAVVSPASLAFVPQGVGTSATQYVVLSNNLTTGLYIGPITFSGADPGDFSQTTTCRILGINRSCTVAVTFAPTATGIRTATMSINDSASNSPQTVSLIGTGE